MIKKIKLICIGSELLNGFTKDLNFKWLSESLSSGEMKLLKVSFINDKVENIIQEIKADHFNYDTIIISGGLGPTLDDLTKNALAKLVNEDLEFHQGFLDAANKQYDLKGKNYNQTHNHYHFAAPSFDPLLNNHGHAPGIRCQFHDTIIFAFPGVPSEFQGMARDYILSDSELEKDDIAVIRTFKITEKTLFSKIDPTLWEKLTELGELSCLPYHSGVDLRLQRHSKLPLKEFHNKLNDVIKNSPAKSYIWSYDKIPLEFKVVDLLHQSGLKLALVESCTGGLISHLLTQVPGVSHVLKGTLVPYQTQEKVKFLGIAPEIISQNGVVSKEVACEMALKGSEKFGADLCLSTTGFASQDGDQFEEGGTVHIALKGAKGIFHERFSVKSTREITKLKFAFRALHMLREYLEN